MKLKIKEKIACSLGGVTSVFHLQMIQIYLLFFYSDVLNIAPRIIALLFFSVRILSAVAGPVFGFLIDKVTLPWGKYKPWILILAIPTGVFGWLTFTAFQLSANNKLIYAVVTYSFYGGFMAITQAATSGMIPAVTKNLDDRISLGSYGFALIMIGAMTVSIGARPIYKVLGAGNDAKGLSMLMGIAGIMGIAIAIFQVIHIKERHVIQAKREDSKVKLLDIIKAVFTNRTALIVYINSLFVSLSYGVKSATTILYFKYYFQNEGLIVIVGIATIVPSLIGVLLSPKITKWMGIKKNIAISSTLQISTLLMVFFIPASFIGIVIFVGSTMIASLFSGFANPAQGTLMPAAMDHIELKIGKNVNAFMGSMGGGVLNIAIAISGAITAGALAVVGYVPNIEQSSATIFGLKILMSILPAILLIPSLTIFWFDLTEDKQELVVKELLERQGRL